jgi:hypothetical protein
LVRRWAIVLLLSSSLPARGDLSLPPRRSAAEEGPYQFTMRFEYPSREVNRLAQGEPAQVEISIRNTSPRPMQLDSFDVYTELIGPDGKPTPHVWRRRVCEFGGCPNSRTMLGPGEVALMPNQQLDAFRMTLVGRYTLRAKIALPVDDGHNDIIVVAREAIIRFDWVPPEPTGDRGWSPRHRRRRGCPGRFPRIP